MANILYSEYQTNPQDSGYVRVTDHMDDGTVNQYMVGSTDPAHPSAQNFATLVARAQTALNNNQTFLAIGSPTNAQAVAQVQALTRQMDAVIYYLLHEITGLSSIAGA
jgi:hypothetical protein